MEKILIVDDDSFLLDMYAVKFCEAQYAVDTSKSVEDALRKMHEGEVYDIILLDMVMPHLTGLDLLRAVHTEKLSKDPLCVVLSNQGETFDIDAAEELGADGYLIKANMIPSEVVKSVQTLWEEKRAGKHKKTDA